MTTVVDTTVEYDEGQEPQISNGAPETPAERPKRTRAPRAEASPPDNTPDILGALRTARQAAFERRRALLAELDGIDQELGLKPVPETHPALAPASPSAPPKTRPPGRPRKAAASSPAPSTPKKKPGPKPKADSNGARIKEDLADHPWTSAKDSQDRLGMEAHTWQNTASGLKKAGEVQAIGKKGSMRYVLPGVKEPKES